MLLIYVGLTTRLTDIVLVLLKVLIHVKNIGVFPDERACCVTGWLLVELNGCLLLGFGEDDRIFVYVLKASVVGLGKIWGSVLLQVHLDIGDLLRLGGQVRKELNPVVNSKVRVVLVPHYVVLLGGKLALEGPLIPVESPLHQILHVSLRAVGGDAVASLHWVWLSLHHWDHLQVLLRCRYRHASLTGGECLGSFDQRYPSVGSCLLWMVLEVGIYAD